MLSVLYGKFSIAVRIIALMESSIHHSMNVFIVYVEAKYIAYVFS
jgi:hypothetical protein